MTDYVDFLLYGSLESSDSDDSDYCPNDFSPSLSQSDSQSERVLTLKLYHNYYIYGL